LALIVLEGATGSRARRREADGRQATTIKGFSTSNRHGLKPLSFAPVKPSDRHFRRRNIRPVF
jgi:hypothetical protein